MRFSGELLEYVIFLRRSLVEVVGCLI